MIAVIPLIVWAIGLALTSGGLGAGGMYLAVKWDDITDGPRPITVTTEEDGSVANFSDAVICVDRYYQAVCSVNHKQYQYCVIEPLDKDVFAKRANARKEEMEKKGMSIAKEPVRGRSKVVEKNGIKVAVVFAVSPWSGKEEKYTVVEQGQSWKIVEEK